MSGGPQSKSESQIANPIIDWALVLYMPCLLIFTVIAIGGLIDWTPLFPDGWGMVAFLGFHVGYGMGLYLLVRWRSRTKDPIHRTSVKPPAPDPDAPPDRN